MARSVFVRSGKQTQANRNRLTPMEQQIKELTAKESAWIQQQLDGAAKLVEIMAPEAAGQPLTLKSLDQAFAAWMALEQDNAEVTNAVINQVGIAFGKVLLE